jgi:hypothetical protein
VQHHGSSPYYLLCFTQSQSESSLIHHHQPEEKHIGAVATSCDEVKTLAAKRLLIVYYTNTGNTGRMAKEIAKGLKWQEL